MRWQTVIMAMTGLMQCLGIAILILCYYAGGDMVAASIVVALPCLPALLMFLWAWTCTEYDESTILDEDFTEVEI